jgi:hypothetical protein
MEMLLNATFEKVPESAAVMSHTRRSRQERFQREILWTKLARTFATPLPW